MIFFTSDQHYGHAAVIRYASRPFADVAEMNEALVARFNDRVSPEDETFHLGDFSLDDRLVRDYLPRLNGRHHLIAGNHDACFPKHRKWRNAADRYHRLGFATIHGNWVDYEEFRLCHFPAVGDHSAEPRYPEYRPPMAPGRALLHGHVHELWRYRIEPASQNGMLNVGVDQWAYGHWSVLK